MKSRRNKKSHRQSAVEGIPEKLSALARAASVLKRSKDILPAPALWDTSVTTEEELGQRLLAIVAEARAQGLDAERALRQATRNWEDRVRASEQATRNGVQDSAES